MYTVYIFLEDPFNGTTAKPPSRPSIRCSTRWAPFFNDPIVYAQPQRRHPPGLQTGRPLRATQLRRLRRHLQNARRLVGLPNIQKSALNVDGTRPRPRRPAKWTSSTFQSGSTARKSTCPCSTTRPAASSSGRTGRTGFRPTPSRSAG